MRNTRILAVVAATACASIAWAQSVTVNLSSPQNGQNVAGGSTVNWSIDFTVSSGDNAGLALLAVDLAQGANPAFIDIPPANAVPPGMSNFSRPAGCSNPGESNPLTGYTGVQRGTPGRKNLVQIGGAQNTFGQALPPGSGIAENANVVGGVGQSGSTLLASGSFVIPTNCGTYTYRIQNLVANVVTIVQTPPQFSPVVGATVTAGQSTITINVRQPGDVDGDNDVDESDLGLLLANWLCTGGCGGDADGDGDVDESDLGILLANWTQVCP